MEFIQQLGKYVEMIPLNTTEIVALAILLYGAVMGLKNGFLKELASMTGFFIGLYLAWKYYDQIGGARNCPLTGEYQPTRSSSLKRTGRTEA